VISSAEKPTEQTVQYDKENSVFYIMVYTIKSREKIIIKM